VRTSSLELFVLTVSIVVVGCSGSEPLGTPGGEGGADNSLGGATSEIGGSSATGGMISNSTGGFVSPTGGVPGTGGTTATGGAAPTGGKAAGGTPPTGGSKAATGGSPPTGTGGMMPATGGSKAGTGGMMPATGGNNPAGTGGSTIAGGMPATGGSKAATGGSAAAGGKATGGTPATGGSKAATGGSAPVGGGAAGGGPDCSATMPTGGTDHCGSNTQGTAAGQSWSLWCNSLSSSACITTFSTPAFSARWNNNSDFLARTGVSLNKTYDQYTSIVAQFSETKTGSAGGYSYIGIYGWSNNPCVEFYILDDSFGTFPFNPYNSSQKGTATIDGDTYKLFQNSTTGTGGNRCGSSVTSWNQFWSVRQTRRTCGTITVSDHFKAWAGVSMALGSLLEASLLVETGGGSGSINFPVAIVTAK
jgi:endo-1,4-beta-xylanase